MHAFNALQLRQYWYELSAVIKNSDGCEIFRTIGNKGKFWLLILTSGENN